MMTREECEAKIVEKLKEIREIAKEYDKSEKFYLTMTVLDDVVMLNNTYWNTETPLDITKYNDGSVICYDN